MWLIADGEYRHRGRERQRRQLADKLAFVGGFEDARIAESSGLAPSLSHADVLWTHNDSGNPNEIYAIAKDGSTAATLTIAGEEARDWEAITSFRSPDAGPAAGQGLIAIGDIGDNDAEHPSVRIAIIEEPQNLADATVTPIRVLRLTYPDGPRDAEALLADPNTGRLYVVSKTLFGSALYAVPPKVWPGKGATGTSDLTRMTKVAEMRPGLVTDGAFLPNGTMAIRGYGNVSIVAAPDTAKNGRLETLASKALPDQEQGESIAIPEADGYALIGSEGKDSPILRIKLPKVATAEATDPPKPSQTSKSTSKSIQEIRDLTGDDTRLPLLIGVGGAGVVLVILFITAIVLRAGRSRRRQRRRR